MSQTTKTEPCTVTPITSLDQLHAGANVTIGKSINVWIIDTSLADRARGHSVYMSRQANGTVTSKGLSAAEALGRLSLVTYPEPVKLVKGQRVTFTENGERGTVRASKPGHSVIQWDSPGDRQWLDNDLLTADEPANLCASCKSAPAVHALCPGCKRELKARAAAEVQPIQQARDDAKAAATERSRDSWAALTGQRL